MKLAARLWSAIRIAVNPIFVVDGASNQSQNPQVCQPSAFMKLSCSACMTGKVKAGAKSSSESAHLASLDGEALQ